MVVGGDREDTQTHVLFSDHQHVVITSSFHWSSAAQQPSHFFQNSWHCGHLQNFAFGWPLRPRTIAGGDPHKNTALEEATNLPRVLLASNHMGMASPSLLCAVATQNILQPR